MQLGVFLDPRLAKQDGLRRVETDAQPVHHHLDSALLNPLRRRVVGRQGVPVGDKKVALILFLQLATNFLARRGNGPGEAVRWVACR